MGSSVGEALRHGRKLKLMRTGRHKTPSQVEKVAEKAGKAAPAMALSAGVLMAAPHGHDASAAKHTTVAESTTTAKSFRASSAQLDSVTRPAQQSHTYTVQSGDTLSKISKDVYGKTGDWPWLYHVNASELKDPNLIYPGEKLNVPSDPPAHFDFTVPSTRSSYVPKHAAPERPDSDSGGSVTVSATASSSSTGSSSAGSSTYTGANGSFQACVIQRESGGNPNVMNASGHYGLYQFSESTWVAYGGSAADFGHASVAEQNQVFANAMARGGESNWAPYDGC
jgi:LysM repeat protein